MLQTGDTIKIGNNPLIFGNYFKGYRTFLFERYHKGWDIDQMTCLVLYKTASDFNDLIPIVNVYALSDYSRARALLIEKEFSFVFLL